MASRNDILLVGLPRSGTSWLGAVLGSSASVEYEREPITQAWISEGLRNTSVDPYTNEEYASLVAETLNDSGSARLIKEVNTLLVPYVSDRDDATTLLLYRHPCAVALSHKERRWTRLDMEALFGLEETGDFWYDHGRLQGLLLAPAVRAIRGRSLIVSYDDLTRDPVAGFARLAAALGLDWSDENAAYAASTLEGKRPTDPYAIKRDAATARDRWMKKLDQSQQKAVLEGYRKHAPRGLPRPTSAGYRSKRLRLIY